MVPEQAPDDGRHHVIARLCLLAARGGGILPTQWRMQTRRPVPITALIGGRR